MKIMISGFCILDYWVASSILCLPCDPLWLIRIAAIMHPHRSINLTGFFLSRKMLKITLSTIADVKSIDIVFYHCAYCIAILKKDEIIDAITE